MPSLADGLIMFGGLLILGFSFAPFVSYHTVASGDRYGAYSANPSAWEWSAYLAPLTWFVVLAGLLLLALGFSHALSGDRILFTFRVSQLQLIVSIYAASILIGYALTDKSLLTAVSVQFMGARMQVVAPPDGDFGWGGVLMLVSALIAVIGALFNLLRVPPLTRPLAY
jgi:hypothetical protein